MFIKQIFKVSRILSLLIMALLGTSTFATELTVGMQAPNFKLQATNGDYYQLSDYHGKQAIVIAWYPMANTRGCTFECKSLVEQGHLIREYDVSYFMVSVDPLDDNRDFLDKLSEVDESERAFEFMMNQLRLHSAFSTEQFQTSTGLSINTVLPLLKEAQQKKLMTCAVVDNEEFWLVTQVGKRYLNDLLEIFL